MRSSTIARRPTRAAVPVRVAGGSRRCERAIGRTRSRSIDETTRNTAKSTGVLAPSASARPASAAPTANGARKNPSVSISPTASTQAAMIQITQPGISASLARGIPRRGVWGSRDDTVELLAERARQPLTLAQRRGAVRARGLGDQRPRELGRVERAQVLELLARPDELDRQPEFPGDGERDATLGGAVELGQHDAADVDRLGEQARLAQPVLAGGGVDGQQDLVRGAV